MVQALPEMAAAPLEAAPLLSQLPEELGEIEGLDETIVKNLATAGYLDAKSLYTVTVEQLLTVDGMDQDLAFRLIDAVHARFGE
jgi:N utilization substance protein A